jgi:hypothetical protein
MRTTPAIALNKEIIRKNHVGIHRLAEQLDISPQKLAAEILAAGIRAIDGSLGELLRVDWPLHLEACDSYSSVQSIARITEQLNAATPKQLMRLEAEGDGNPQAALWNRATTDAVDVEIDAEIDAEILKAARIEARTIGVNVASFIRHTLRNHLEGAA